MRTSFKSAVAGVLTLAVAGVVSAAGATSAAAAAPVFDPDPNKYGTITFYDATGNVVTSGDANDPLSMKYSVASTNPTSPVTNPRAQILLYGPQPAVNPGLWSGIPLNANTLYPIVTAPAPVSASAFPASALLATSTTMKAASTTFTPNTAASGLQNVFQMRLKSALIPDYAATTITIDPVTNVWQQIDPVVADSTKTVLTVSGANPADAPASPTLTATVSRTAGTQTPLPAGNVEFFNGTTSLGLPSAVNAAGVATKALTAIPVGSYSYTAVFTPTTATAFLPSTSSVVPFVVAVGAATPVIGLTATPAVSNVGDSVTFTATITPAAAGTIEFFDGANSLAPASATLRTYTTTTLAAGQHPVTAKFVSADLAAFRSANSAGVTVTVQTVLLGACATTPANCTDAQAFIAEVAAGSLVISTPFHTANPFNLGILALNNDATELSSGLKSFAGQDPAGKGITITDTRGGNNNWTAALSSSPFTAGLATIDPKFLGFTQVGGSYVDFNALQAGDVLFSDNAAASFATPALTGLASSKTFATAPIGVGTVYVNGSFTLNAPTSTPAGNYFGTVTFTIA